MSWILVIIVLGGDLPAIHTITTFRDEAYCLAAGKRIRDAVAADRRAYSAVVACVLP